MQAIYEVSTVKWLFPKAACPLGLKLSGTHLVEFREKLQELTLDLGLYIR